MTASPGGSPPVSGWWRRLGRIIAALWLRLQAEWREPEPDPRPDPQPSTPKGSLTARRSITPLAVPARGHAFDFQVNGVFVWSTDETGRDDLHTMVDHFLPYAQHYLKGVAAGLARGVEPHRGEDFERRLRHRLTESGGWTFERRSKQVTCRAHVRVRLDERVQQHIRPYWEKLIALDYERDIAARRARHADQISAQWEAILRRLLAGSLPDGAAQMADEQLATVVKDLLAQRAAESGSWTEALRNLSPQNEYEREGYFDLLDEGRDRRPPG